MTQLTARPVLQVSYQAIQSQQQIFWRQWKKVPKAPQESIDRQIKVQQQRWKTYVRFLQAIGNVADSKETVLYYPGAGLDFNSLLVTGLREGVFVDPAYLKRWPSGYTSRQLRTLIRSYAVRNARFTFPHRRLMRAQFDIARRRFQLWILQGKNGAKSRQIRQCLGGKPIVYLVKGTAQKTILHPPPSIARLNPQAYAVDFFTPTAEFGLTLQGYHQPVFMRHVGERQLIIFKTYDFGLAT